MSWIRSHKPWSYFWLLVSLSFIFIATISPFNFAIPEGFSWQSTPAKFKFGSNLKDYWQNILLFVPWGFSLSIIAARQQKKAWILLLILSLLASASLSTAVELTQLFLQTRVSNLTDIIYNTAGGVLGSILYLLRINIITFFTAIVTGNIKQLSYQSILLVIFGYCLTIVLLILILLFNVNLNNWDSEYHLAIGNEVTANRPWDGYINSLHISDRGMNLLEVAKAFKATDFFADDSSLITSLNFNSYQKTYPDSRGQLPDLLWQTKKAKVSKLYVDQSAIKSSNLSNNVALDRSIAVNSQQWLKTKLAATYLNNRLKKTDEFTLSLTIASNNINQGGPARILTLSKGIYIQNMIVGQEETDLHFRLKTPVTGLSAAYPAFVVPNVFGDREAYPKGNRTFHRILITFANRRLNFYIDQAENKYSFTFNPSTSFITLLPWNNYGWSVNFKDFSPLKYQIRFYTVILLPFVLLLFVLTIKYISDLK